MLTADIEKLLEINGSLQTEITTLRQFGNFNDGLFIY